MEFVDLQKKFQAHLSRLFQSHTQAFMADLKQLFGIYDLHALMQVIKGLKK